MNFKSVLCVATMLAAAGVAQAFPDYTLYPADGASFSSAQNLANFNVTFNGANVVVADGAEASLISDQGDEAYSTNFMYFMGALLINFDSSEIVANGQWVLNIPAGSFTANDEPNPEISAVYTLADPNLGVGEYPQITLESISPADGTPLHVWGGEDFEVKIKTSDDDAVNYIAWSLYDVTDGVEKYKVNGNDSRYDFNRYLHHDDIWADGLFIAVASETKLILDHTYRLDLRFCGIGYDDEHNQSPTPQQIQLSTELQTSVYYKGLVPPQEYAEAKYEDIDPNPETYDIDDPNLAMFTVTYTAPAKPVEFNYSLGGGLGTAPAGTYAPFEGMELVDGLCTKWTFTFDPSIIADRTGTISTNIQSMDNDGRFVRGNGEDMDFDDVNYNIIWNCNCGAPELTSVEPIAFSTVESLSSITLSNDKDGRALPMQYSYNTAEKMRIITRQGEEVRVLENSESLIYSDDNTQATWSFEPITANGNYVLIVPKYFFAIGEEFEGASSNLTTFEYIVDNGETPSDVVYDITPVEVAPASGSNVAAINDIVLTFADATFYPMNGSAPQIQLYAKEGPGATLLQSIDFYNESQFSMNDDWNPTVYTIHFEEVIADGEYEVVIPQGLFCDIEYDESEGKSGHANAEIVLNYTIGSTSVPSKADFSILPVSVTPADNTTVAEISTVTVEFGEVVFPMQYFEGLAVTFAEGVLYKVSDEGEEEISSVEPVDNPAAVWFNPMIYDFHFKVVTDNGQYKVVIPKGTFGDDPFLGSDGEEGKANAEIILYYAIGETVGVDAIVAGDSVINVYDINGVQILKNANVEAAKELKSGLYIINGKKVMIRR